jgi:hypothetical protein
VLIVNISADASVLKTNSTPLAVVKPAPPEIVVVDPPVRMIPANWRVNVWEAASVKSAALPLLIFSVFVVPVVSAVIDPVMSAFVVAEMDPRVAPPATAAEKLVSPPYNGART